MRTMYSSNSRLSQCRRFSWARFSSLWLALSRYSYTSTVTSTDRASVGYREIPEFTKELSVSAEVTAEKAAVMEKTAEILEGAAAEAEGGETDRQNFHKGEAGGEKSGCRAEREGSPGEGDREKFRKGDVRAWHRYNISLIKMTNI